MAFDTLRYSQRLQQVGVSREQAEAHAELARDMILDEVATKGDIRSLKADIVTAEERFQGKLDLLEQRMTIKVGAMLVALFGLIVAALKFVH